VAALPDGGFALLFARGRASERRLQLQRLSADLTAVGAPVDVTAPDQAQPGAAAGALYWAGDKLLAFHFLGGDSSSSLWVSSLECDPG
jgi:hypothetical protein